VSEALFNNIGESGALPAHIRMYTHSQFTSSGHEIRCRLLQQLYDEASRRRAGSRFLSPHFVLMILSRVFVGGAFRFVK